MSESTTSNLFEQAQVRPSKKPKLRKDPYIYFSSEIWDKLSKINLTKNVLKELDRRYKGLNTFEVLPHHKSQISQESLEAIRKIARQGGPDLADLEGYPDTTFITMASEGNRSGHLSRPENPTTSGRGTKTTRPYDKMFDRKLQDGGIYPHYYINPETGDENIPGNLAELQQRANQPRGSVSLTIAQYRAFTTAVNNAENEREVVAFVVPLLEGQFRVSNQGFIDTTFSNLALLISLSLESGALVKGTPDRCYGTPFERLNESIRNELSRYVVPTKDTTQPIAPNFFLELKGSEGHINVAKRKARYYGALGERGQIALRSWRHPESVLDGFAHTISCIFISGHLRLFSIHSAQSRTPGRNFDYFIYPIEDFAMDMSYQKFKNGVAAYQNLQQHAEEMREESIRLANARNNSVSREANEMRDHYISAACRTQNLTYLL